MHLDKLAVCVVAALLVKRRLSGSGADDGIRRFAENCADASSRDNDGVSRKDAYFHGAQIHGANTAANSFSIEHGRQKFPVLKFFDLAFGLVAADLFVQRIEKLLTRSGPGECGAVIECPAEAPKIEQTLGSAIEGHTHAVEQVNNGRSRVAHRFDRRLVCQEVSAVNGVIEMLPGGVAFAFQVLGRINSALRANRMGALHRDNREQVDLSAHLGNFYDCGKTREPSTYYYDFRI